MNGVGTLAALLTTLVSAAFGVLSGSAAARGRAQPVTVLGLAAILAAGGADLVALTALATGLALGILVAATDDPWTGAPRPRGDRRVVPGAAAAIAFAVLYQVVVGAGWPAARGDDPVALTSLVGARLLTGDFPVVAVVVLLVCGALVGAVRIVGREVVR